MSVSTFQQQRDKHYDTTPRTRSVHEHLRALSSQSLNERRKAHRDAQPNRILVVNDNSRLANHVIDYLQKSNAQSRPLFVPSLATAQLMLTHYEFDLIIASALLPDGSITKLEATLSALETPPPVIVVDKLCDAAHYSLDTDYRFARLRHYTQTSSIESHFPTPTSSRERSYIDSVVQEVSADLRDQLNNPLQEIVAMVYVAKSAQTQTDVIESALIAIERAASEMNETVRSLVGEHHAR